MKLDEVVPWGRSLEEYRKFFALSAADLDLRMLGCGDGPASFNCEMAAAGRPVVSIDPIYAFSGREIQQRVEATYDTIIGQVKQNASHYVWRNFRDADELGRARLEAMQRFIEDFDAGLAAGRYRSESLPRLNFADQQFELCLCSHLLFLYSGQLSLQFHLESLSELLRVGAEVRVFPLLTLAGQQSPYIEPVKGYFTARGITVQVERVEYEFQRGGNRMMRLRR